MLLLIVIIITRMSLDSLKDPCGSESHVRSWRRQPITDHLKRFECRTENNITDRLKFADRLLILLGILLVSSKVYITSEFWEKSDLSFSQTIAIAVLHLHWRWSKIWGFFHFSRVHASVPIVVRCSSAWTELG